MDLQWKENLRTRAADAIVHQVKLTIGKAVNKWNHRTQNNGNDLWSIALTQHKLTECSTIDVASEALP